MESKLNFETKELETLLHDNSPIVKKDIQSGDSSNKTINGNENTEEHISNGGNFDPISSNHNLEVQKRRGKKLRINKSLITFRIAHLLWYGGGCLPNIFLGIFMKQRGFTIIELSSVFSLIFLFQFICCSIAGAIADKIGNAKPVLLFLMFSTSCLLISITLFPNINKVSCPLMQKNLSDFNESESNKNFNSCYLNCLLNNNSQLSDEVNSSKNSLYENTLFKERLPLITDNNKTVCDSSVIPSSNTSLNLPKDDCCNTCKNRTNVDCVTIRSGFLVILYSIFILVFYAIWCAAYRFMNFTAVSLSFKNDSHFGKEFAFAKCGDLLIFTLVGFVLNIDKSSGNEINFDPVLWIAAGAKVLALLTLSLTTVPILPPGKNLFKNAFRLVRDIDILVFILVVFIAGNGFSFMFTFRLVFLETMNATRLLVALHSIAIIIYAFPLLLTSKWWLGKFGTNKIAVLCLLFYTVNNVAYSFIYNPWWSLLIDTSIAFTYYLFWVTVVLNSWNVAPVGFAATLNALIGAVHFGVGCSSGVFFGGILMNYLGIRTAYRIMAAIFFVTAILYSIFLYSRRKSHLVNNKSNDDGIMERTLPMKVNVPAYD